MPTYQPSNYCPDFLKAAIEEAQNAQQLGEVPIGAVVVKNNEIIARGHNQPITTQDPSAHAEIVAMRRAAKALENYRLINCDVYVTLEPCPMCLGAMIYARIRNLFFAAYDAKLGAVNSVYQLLDAPQINHYIHAQGGMMASECATLLRDFFKSKR